MVQHSTALSLILWLREETPLEPEQVALVTNLLMNLPSTPMFAGTLSMPNSGPNTNGSQFFITYAPQPHLDLKHTVFGQLVLGANVLKAIKNGDTIVRITIEES